jgi:DNA-binding NarL/FixJ family response regulator
MEHMHGAKRADPAADAELPAPEGLRQSQLEVDAEQYLVLSYPLPPWELPCVLTSAEQEIALAILAGRSRREVAHVRGTSVRTVSNLLSQVFRKLGVRSRIELASRLSAAARPREPNVEARDSAREPIKEKP